MAMNQNVNMAGMNPMGGPVGGAPMPMMNNGAVNPQVQAAAAAARQQQMNDSQRGVLNTYIYEYFLRYEMFDCARSLINSNQPVNVLKEGANRRRDENGNIINGVGDDPMDTDSKDDLDSKLPEDLPPPKLPMPASDTSFLYEWFCLFWDIYNAQRVKGGNGTINQYVAHTQQQSRMKQNQQQELLRQMRPNMTPQQFQMMRNMQNEGMAMNMKQGNLARAAMANNQNPQMMLQQAKQNQMQRDPSGMDPNRDRPSSPASGENAPSPSKRQRVDAPFNPNQAGGMMPNGRPVQGMPGQQMPGNTAAAQQMLAASGINPNNLNAQQFQNFANAPPAAQQKSIATYAQTLQQHHGNQMGGNKQMPNAGGPQGQGSPMLAQGPDGTTLATFYNPNDMGGPGGIRAGPNGPQAAGSSNHALQDYQMQLMLLEQQNKKRLMMARQEQDTMGGAPGAPGGPGGPGGPPGPNGQQFPDTSPQAMRTGASPNPAEQMKRGTPQMNNSSVPSPVPEGGQSRGSPNPGMNFMGNHVDPNMGPHFFKGMDGNMQQMNGMRPPSSHPNQQPFSGQMNPQMIARQQAAQQQGQPGQQPQGGQGNPQQWQPGPNGQMVPQNMQQQSPQIQGTPQQRSMPPPSAPAAAGTNANRTTASPQQAAAAPPTPNQGNKAAPKKKENKNAKDKKKTNPSLNAGATPAGENSGDQDTPAPATPITPANTNFKNGQNTNAGQNGQPTSGPAPAPAPAAPVAATSAPPTAPVAPPGHGDPNQNGMGMDSFGSIVDFGGMELANPLQSGDVLNDFDFDSFLHDGDAENQPFDFNGTFSAMEGGEIGAE